MVAALNIGKGSLEALKQTAPESATIKGTSLRDETGTEKVGRKGESPISLGSSVGPDLRWALAWL